jgi:hypothetical protein
MGCGSVCLGGAAKQSEPGGTPRVSFSGWKVGAGLSRDEAMPPVDGAET